MLQVVIASIGFVIRLVFWKSAICANRSDRLNKLQTSATRLGKERTCTAIVAAARKSPQCVLILLKIFERIAIDLEGFREYCLSSDCLSRHARSMQHRTCCLQSQPNGRSRTNQGSPSAGHRSAVLPRASDRGLLPHFRFGFQTRLQSGLRTWHDQLAP